MRIGPALVVAGGTSQDCQQLSHPWWNERTNDSCPLPETWSVDTSRLISPFSKLPCSAQCRSSSVQYTLWLMHNKWPEHQSEGCTVPSRGSRWVEWERTNASQVGDCHQCVEFASCRLDICLVKACARLFGGLSLWWSLLRRRTLVENLKAVIVIVVICL